MIDRSLKRHRSDKDPPPLVRPAFILGEGVWLRGRVRISIRRVRRERVFVPLRIIGPASRPEGALGQTEQVERRSRYIIARRVTGRRCFLSQRIIGYRADRDTLPPSAAAERQ